MRKQIRINTSYLAEWMRDYYLDLLKDDFEFIEVAEDPDYVLVGANQSNFLRGEEYIAHYHLNEFPKAAIRVYLQHEAVGFDTTLFDYAVLFCDDLDLGDRVFFANFFSAGYFRVLAGNVFERLNAPKQDARTLLAGKDAFCNFIYSHGGVPEREGLFNLLSSHRFVESHGKLLNNMSPDEGSLPDTHYRGNWFEEGIDLRRNTKFSISAENALHPKGYYVSEKIVSAMLGNTIPIYWGNPEIGRIFNSRAFINCHNFASFDDVLKRVIEVDTNDDLWCEMMAEPWMTPEQYLAASGNQEKLKDFLTNIFTPSLDEARRRPRGFWAGRYETAERRLLADAVRYRKQKLIDIPVLREKFLERFEGERSGAQINSAIAELRALRKRMTDEQWEEFLEPELNPKSRLMRLVVDSNNKRSDKVKLAIAFHHGGRGWGIQRNRTFSVRWLRTMVEDGILEPENASPKALLYWGTINMTGEPPIVERNPRVALACFARLENSTSPKIRNTVLHNQMRIHLEEHDIPRAEEVVARLLLSRSIEKPQIPLLLEILSHEAPLGEKQKKRVRAALAVETITDLESWKKLDSWKLPWRFRKNVKRLRKSLEERGYFSSAGAPTNS
jgi:alpha(1,3/1,4) fucosyltransferase